MSIQHPSDIFPKIYGELLDKFGKPKELSIDFLPNMDNKIWGLRKKQMVVVAGRVSMAKSCLLLQMAHAFAKQGKTVLFFTLEMTIQECVLRLFNAHCYVDNWANLAGISPEDHKKYELRVADFQKHLEELNLVFIEGYGKTHEEIFKTIDTIAKGKTVDAVFIDYIQMIRVGNKTDKQAIDEYIKHLRVDAIAKNYCVVLGCQINRASFDGSKVNPPELHMMKSSGTIEEVMDVCFLLHWEYFYSRDKTTFNDYQIRVGKNRMGRTGIWDCHYEPKYSRIGEKHEQ